MAGPFYEDNTTPSAAGVGYLRSCWLDCVSGENHSGAEAWLQIYNNATPGVGDAPMYSVAAQDHQTVSIVLAGFNDQIAGRLITPEFFVGWSSDVASYVAVEGTWNIAGTRT